MSSSSRWRARVPASRALVRVGRSLLGVALTVLLMPPDSFGAAAPMTGANLEYRARSMYKKGLGYLAAKNTEPGVKILQDIPRMFPELDLRFDALLSLGRHYIAQSDYEAALLPVVAATRAYDLPVKRAEALYLAGRCHYELGDFNKAFVSLRKVTTGYPWTVFANESYYYIGLCHFRLKRWTRAYEALRMVGVSVPTDLEHRTSESSHKLWVKVADRDLVILLGEEDPQLPVAISSRGGDAETVILRPNNRDGTEFLGSIDTVPGEPVPGDGVLQVMGDDEVTATYADKTTESGEQNREVVTRTRMVSTASIGFTDGAYADYLNGVYGGQPAFIRLKDLDGNQSIEYDYLDVRVSSRYKIPAAEQDVGSGMDDDRIQYRERDALTITLTESESTSGMFHGRVDPILAEGTDDSQADASVMSQDDRLVTRVGDELVVEYQDDQHILDEPPRSISYNTIVLSPRRNDVEATQWVVRDDDLRARKDLIEARILLRLGQIFKDVGLRDKAFEKAEAGLERAEEVVRLAVSRNLDQATIEAAFNVKWDLLLVQDRLSEAVQVCNTLLRLFPSSAIADRALLNIGMAKAQSRFPSDWREAIRVFSSILRLKESPLKAEAQYRVAEAQEQLGYERARGAEQSQLSQQAIVAYRRCAEMWPDSAFAGQSLEKVVQFYIDTEDYSRALDMMEMIFQDFQDSAFLDVMLLKWAIVAEKMNNRALARAKLDELISEYPDSSIIRTAVRFRERLNRAQSSDEEL